MSSNHGNTDFNEDKTGRLGHSLANIEEISFEDRKLDG